MMADVVNSSAESEFANGKTYGQEIRLFIYITAMSTDGNQVESAALCNARFIFP
jgi:hypothetical protein